MANPNPQRGRVFEVHRGGPSNRNHHRYSGNPDGLGNWSSIIPKPTREAARATHPELGDGVIEKDKIRVLATGELVDPAGWRIKLEMEPHRR